MDGKRFSCNIEHEGYDATAGEDVKSTWFEIRVVGNVNLSISCNIIIDRFPLVSRTPCAKRGRGLH